MKRTTGNNTHEGDEELDLLTPAQVAKRLSVTVSWLYRAVERGEFPVVRVGKYIRVEAGALKKYIASRRQG
jgi:excisionase family DNA binding protein